jgi:hypothetical protein
MATVPKAYTPIGRASMHVQHELLVLLAVLAKIEKDTCNGTYQAWWNVLQVQAPLFNLGNSWLYYQTVVTKDPALSSQAFYVFCYLALDAERLWTRLLGVKPALYELLARQVMEQLDVVAGFDGLQVKEALKHHVGLQLLSSAARSKIYNALFVQAPKPVELSPQHVYS